MPLNLSVNSADFSECTAHGACTISPNVSSLQEAMIILLRQVSFYLLKLEGFGIKHDDIESEIIKQVASIDLLGEYPAAQTLGVFSKFYIMFANLKNLYKEKCIDHNVPCAEIKNKIVLTADSGVSSIISQGEKAFKEKYKKLSENQRELVEILFGVMKGVSNNIITYKDLGRVYEPATNTVLDAFELLNDIKIPAAKITDKLNELVGINVELVKFIYAAETELYGQVEKVDVELSSRPGHAIMVSGSSLKDLYSVLEMTKNKDIDVYSNGNLLIAHSYPNLRSYPNFRGHFGAGIDGSIMDLATFPGSILLTKNQSRSVEYLYRGRLFTTDDVATKGVSKINSDDMSELLESAMKTGGFKTGRTKGTVSIGFDYDKLDKDLDSIAKKFKNKTYKKLIMVGFAGDTQKQAQYFEKLFSKLPDDVFLISMSYEADCGNTLTLNPGRSYSLVYSIMSKIFDKLPVAPEDVSVFLSRCDVRSLSNIINFKNRGFNVFLSNCSPRVINPATLKAFRKIFKIRETSTPKKDLAIISED